MRWLSWPILASFALVLSAGLPVMGQAAQPNAARFREAFIKLDSNGDTVLERDEIPADGRAAFERLLKRGDANKNGKLEAEEFRALAQKLAVLNDITDVQARFKRMDKNEDGKVTRAEFTGVPANFDKIDADKDGSLSKAEIARFFTRRVAAAGLPALAPRAEAGDKPKAKAVADSTPKPDQAARKAETPAPAVPKEDREAEKVELSERFRFLDKNGDGKISKGEFLNEKLFEHLDTNKDGFLSLAELAKFAAPEE